MRPSFAHGPSPMIVGVIRERTPREAIAQIKNGEIGGARGFDLHLDALDEQYRTVEAIRDIVDSTSRPILALNYNNGYFEKLTMNEEERTSLLMTAVDAGVSAVDLQGYSFDNGASGSFVDDADVPEELAFLKTLRPREVALKPMIVEKQRAFIKAVHDKGAEVLLSMHLGVHVKAEELIALTRYVYDLKGPDIIKLVTPCENEEQLADCLYSTVMLKKELSFPFSYHASGKAGIPSRKICPMLGSHIMFCNVSYSQSSNFEQLHLSSMTEAYRCMDTY